MSRNRLKFDLIHAHFAHEMGYVGAILSKMMKKPLLLTVHGSDMNIRIKFSPDKERIIFALNKAARVIAVSNNLKERVSKLGICEEKVVTIIMA